MASTKKFDLDALFVSGNPFGMTPEQCRAARGWLGWSQTDLAQKAKVGLSTVKDFEGARRIPIVNNLAAIQAALEKGGIGFEFDGERACGITYARVQNDAAH